MSSVFHRHQLAEKIVQMTLSDKGSSGIFLSAPRRTGKSTLIREDIIPLLRSKGAEVIYVDLWSDRQREPSDLITDAIKDHLGKQEGKILEWIKKSKIDKVSLAGIQLDINKIGIGGEKTIAKGLAELSDATKAVVVMVIDEAQHAITTEAGNAALFALKAARDQLNSSEHYGFRLIATGSNRDKLSLLTQGKDQAFLAARLMDLPLLDASYLNWELDQLDLVDKPSLVTIKQVFEVAGYKPEILRKALDDLFMSLDVNAANVDTILMSCMNHSVETLKAIFFSEVNALPPLQTAVLVVMANTGQSFAPFRAKTYALYAEICQQLTDESIKIDDSSVQYALEALRTKTLIWKSARGVYAIEDSQHEQWLKNFGQS